MKPVRRSTQRKNQARLCWGLLWGHSKRIDARPDPEESETILIDCDGDKAEGDYLEAIREYRELRVEFGIATPQEQHAHDCELPNGE